MTRIVSLLALLGLLAATPAAAQDGQALADARQLIQTLHLVGVRDQIVNGTLVASYRRMLPVNKGKEAEVKSFLEQAMLPALRAREGDITEQQARLFTKHFTAAELHQLLAFYSSPLGTKLVTTFPVVIGEMQQYANSWAGSVLASAQPTLAAEAKKRGLTLPAS